MYSSFTVCILLQLTFCLRRWSRLWGGPQHLGPSAQCCKSPRMGTPASCLSRPRESCQVALLVIAPPQRSLVQGVRVLETPHVQSKGWPLNCRVGPGELLKQMLFMRFLQGAAVWIGAGRSEGWGHVTVRCRFPVFSPSLNTLPTPPLLEGASLSRPCLILL